MKPLVAVDGDSFAHRAYHALPKSIRRADGGPAGLLVGIGNLLVRLWEEETPRAIVVAWDTLTVPTYRHVALESYQGGREFDADLLEQLDLAPELCEAMGFAVAKGDGYEADDFLAAAAYAEEARNGCALVASGDRDTFQLASERTTILQPQRGGGALARIGPAEVRARYGVEPTQVPDFIALRGDPSDRIPGARGVGPKTAADLLAKYTTLEHALAEGRFEREAEELRLYRHIATMDTGAPLPPLEDQTPTWGHAAELAAEWGLGRLSDRLRALEGSSSS
ncbi:MAG: 5'-3' exonuclease [Actinomycetota bacterium]|nr:5'-3' exonuclease [Actinomycetota bacterium]